MAFIGALFKGWQMVREGARAREREAIAGLEKWRDDADKRAARALAEADYQRRLVAWHQSRVGMRDYVILAHGLPVPEDPAPPPPPPALQEPDHDST